MGSCFSSDSDQVSPPTAKVVSLNGDLQEYCLPVFVYQVLCSQSGSSSASYFLCNSDHLTYDDYIPALAANALLHPNALYFVLPNSKLQQKLSPSDMAALAVKASLALGNASKKDALSRKRARISPVMAVNQIESDPQLIRAHEDYNCDDKPKQQQQILPKSGSVRRLRKYTSRRAKLAVRSFRLRLSTIYEGTPL